MKRYVVYYTTSLTYGKRGGSHKTWHEAEAECKARYNASPYLGNAAIATWIETEETD